MKMKLVDLITCVVYIPIQWVIGAQASSIRAAYLSRFQLISTYHAHYHQLHTHSILSRKMKKAYQP